MRTSTNVPYRKEYDSEGILLNPITQDNPLISYDSNRKKRRESFTKR